MPTRYGTAHFVDHNKAAQYYRDQCHADGFATVREKLAAGEIHIGPPTLKKGERLVLIDNGCRYAIEEAKPQPKPTAAQINRAAKQKQKQEDAYIERAYYKSCSGIQIDVMDIGKVFAHGRTLLATCESLDALAAGLRAYVETIRKN